MATKTYTVKHLVNLDLLLTESGFALASIIGTDPEEAELISTDDGEYACWDAGVETTKTGFRIVGSDGPGGGTRGVTVELLVPYQLVRKMEVSVDRY